MYDCIVIGAGPAGLATAYSLAQRGRSVLVLEKSDWPRYKPCSGAVSPSVAKYFDFDFAPAIARKARRVRYTWKLGDPVEARLDTQEPIWIVDRAVFDGYLAEQAQLQGAEFKAAATVIGIQFQGDSWQVNTEAERFSGRYIVAADGASGPTAGWLGLTLPGIRTAAVLEAATVTPVSADAAVWFDFGLVKNGCLWAFPKPEGYSIGAATFRGKNLQDFQKPLTQFAEAIGAAYGPERVYSHPIKIWDGNQPLHGERALVVGEAAAIVDPISAEGIRPGMISGVQAAKAIHAALAGNPGALADYTQTVHTVWGSDLQWAQRIANLFYRVPGIGYRVGIKRPTMTARMGQLLTGEICYADVANRVIKRLSGGLIG